MGRVSGERLLLVDDEDNLRSMLEAALRHSGFDVHPVASGRAAILVPFAGAADDHQTTNARAFEAKGAARVLEERTLTGDVLADAVTQLVEAPRTLAEMGAAARRLGRPDAAARVADLLVKGSGGARA